MDSCKGSASAGCGFVQCHFLVQSAFVYCEFVVLAAVAAHGACFLSDTIADVVAASFVFVAFVARGVAEVEVVFVVGGGCCVDSDVAVGFAMFVDGVAVVVDVDAFDDDAGDKADYAEVQDVHPHRLLPYLLVVDFQTTHSTAAVDQWFVESDF